MTVRKRNIDNVSSTPSIVTYIDVWWTITLQISSLKPLSKQGDGVGVCEGHVFSQLQYAKILTLLKMIDFDRF